MYKSVEDAWKCRSGAYGEILIKDRPVLLEAMKSVKLPKEQNRKGGKEKYSYLLTICHVLGTPLRFIRVIRLNLTTL